ncbi:hypothetical protein [Streptomyces sp. NPDC050704]|uniref:hypothetical protein n=1 Tax=Streptomyces sp. NPDC050704 TaxID=3157219 RepID=UPI0034245205
MKDVHEDLRARLRDTAEAYEPDRAHILARVERGMAGAKGSRRSFQRSPALGWFRVIGATAAAAGVLAVGGYAVASAVKDEPADQTVAVTPTPDPSPEATSRAPIPPDPPKPSAPPASSNAPASPTAKPQNPAPLPPADAGEEDGPLWSDGSVDPHSNDFWAQSNVTVKAREELTALTVELRIAQTGGVTSTGAWRSLPEADFTQTVEERDGFLVYTWVLKPGRTVPKGEFVFAGQYDHDRGGRDAGGDRYSAAAKTDGEQLGVAGDFARTGDDDDSDDGDS